MKKGKSPVQTVSAVYVNAYWREKGIEATREMSYSFMILLSTGYL